MGRIENYGLLIDRNQALTFQFDKKTISGFHGDTLASALLASNETILARSFKYHRPRSLMGSGVEEANVLLGIGEDNAFEPNARATMEAAREGLVAQSQNRFPSLKYDMGAINNRLSRFFPAGFYYKTFLFPRFAWKWLYEPIVRQSAGLGKATKPNDPDYYEHYYAFFDIVIAGGGVSGLMAAELAGQAGLKVLLAEQSAYWGGRAIVDYDMLGETPTMDWVQSQIAKLEAMDNVTMRLNMQISGSYDHGYVLANENMNGAIKNRLWRIRSKHLIAASGAIERPLAFANNDLPKIMLSTALRDYLKLYGVAAGKKLIVVTNNDDAYLTALSYHQAGIKVVAVIDARENPSSSLIDAVIAAGIDVKFSKAIAKAKGKSAITGVEICDLDSDGSQTESLECDCLAMSGGFSPVVHLWSHCGGKLQWNDSQAFFAPNDELPPVNDKGEAMVHCIGAAHGELEHNAGIEQVVTSMGNITGKSPKKSQKLPQISEHKTAPILPVWIMPMNAPYELRAKSFLDFQHDVKVSDIALAAQEGFQSVEHANRYTTLGMATDQGKTSNINGLAILAKALDKEIAQVGTTTFRPPYTPIPMGAIAGIHSKHLFKPLRKTVVDHWHEARAPIWEPVADWRRPYTYCQEGEDAHQSVIREVNNTRSNVGLLDASTLGKILVTGPDAGKFLDLIYTNMMSTLKPGFCRYGLMTNENGFLHDDGVVACIAENQYICHTTSGGSDRVHAMMEEWLQTEWWDLEVYTSNLTEHYAQFAVVGPKARRVLESLGGMDVSSEALPFMQWKDGELGGFSVRVYRISFSGELSYEIAVRADEGEAFWNKLNEIGNAYEMMPYGTEALHVMRAEKGFIMIGDETDGTVTPYDVNLNWAVSKKKADFLGKRGLERPLFHDQSRRKLVGLFTEDAQTVLPHAAHAIEGVNEYGNPKAIGYVTSSYYSPTLERSIAMALIENGVERMGEVLTFPCADGRKIRAKIVDPVFYDKEGLKQNVE